MLIWLMLWRLGDEDDEDGEGGDEDREEVERLDWGVVREKNNKKMKVDESWFFEAG